MKRDQSVIVKMNEQEKSLLERLARREYRTMADTVRYLIVEKAKELGEILPEEEQKQLGR